MPPARPPHTSAGPTTDTPFGRKLGYYLLGLAIGLVMVGMIVSARQRALGPTPPTSPPPTAPTPTAAQPAAPGGSAR